jgi:hypothetical protein
VLAIVFRNVFAGLIAMLPNLFPIMIVFGALGWMKIKIDIGIMMTASVALGVAVDNTVHLVTWFRHAQSLGYDRRASTLMAYERCATAMAQSALVGGLGLLVFSFSTFTPTKQFGYLMITILMAALVGDLVLLPALLCGPLGKFFARKPSRRGDPSLSPALAMVADTAADVGVASFDDDHDHAAPTKSDAISASAQFSRTDNGHSPHEPNRKPVDAETLESSKNTALRDKLRSFRRP